MAKKAKQNLKSPYILNPNGSIIPERQSVTYYDASKRKFISVYFDLSVKDELGSIDSWIGKHASEIGLLSQKMNWAKDTNIDKNYVLYFKPDAVPANLPM